MISIEQTLFNYLIHNTALIKSILQPIKDDAGELLKNDDVNAQFLDRARWVVVTHLCLQLKVSVDMVLEFMDNINVKELLK